MKLNLPDEFYQEEVRCGYMVSSEMKEIWAVELDLLREFSEVCERNHLRYFMDGGTLLGAIRHKGFIPWDDDADVIMPREDYDRLWEIADKEFRHPYFFQTTVSENGFFRTHAQLRNSETTGCIAIDREKDINRGIFIDVFVLDGVADHRITRFFQRKRINFIKRILAYQYDRDYATLSRKQKVFYKLVHCFFRYYDFKKFYQYFNHKVLARFSDKKTRLIGDLTLKWRKNVQWPAEWYDGYFYLPFENLMLRAPLFYKDIMERQYGAFMKIPENVAAANGRVHGTVLFDPHHSYREVLDDQKQNTIIF